MTTLEDKVKKTIEKHHMLTKGDRVILGLSGGTDSLSLFYVLKDLSKELEIRLYCVHVNHMFRQEEAIEDQKCVEALCKKYEIPCYSYVVDCPAMAKEEGLSLEEAGRKARYDAFGKAVMAVSQVDSLEKSNTSCEKNCQIKVAVAQNQNDQAETVLMRMIRGTGLEWLGAMEYSREDSRGYAVIRPLLDVPRKEIEAYCRQQKLMPRLDYTNEDDRYMRNRIRHRLLPYLEANYNSNIIEGLSRMAENLQNDKVYLQQQVALAMESVSFKTDGDSDNESEASKKVLFYRDRLQALPKALRNRIIRSGFIKVGLDKDVTTAHLQQANSLLDSGKASGETDFPCGYQFHVSYNQVFMTAPGGESEKTVPLKLKKTFLSLKTLRSTEANRQDSLKRPVCRLDARQIEKREEVAGPLELRTRKPGDWMAMGYGTKKIQDLFVDSHVPKERRDTIYLVALGDEILWIPDMDGKSRYTASYKVGDHTAQVLQLEIIK